MKINLHKNEVLTEDCLDIHYRKMNPLIKRIMSISKDTSISKVPGKSEDNQMVFFDIEKVLYFESVDKRTFAYLIHDIYEVEESLTQIENYYKPYGFVRINKSNVVNIYQIESIKPELNMRVRANMENGEYLMINRSYKKSFDTYLKERRSS